MKRVIDDYSKPHFVYAKISDGNGKKLKPDKMRKHFKIILVILAIFLAIFMAVCAILIYSPVSFKLKNSNYYMLILHKTNNLGEADSLRRTVSLSGGAGYVINDGDFLIAAFVYNKKSEANTVLQRVKPNYEDADICDYTLPATKIKRFDNRSGEKSLKNLLNYPISLASSLVEIVYSLDSYNITESAAMLKVLQLLDDVVINKEKMLQLNNLVADNSVISFSMDFYNKLFSSFNLVTDVTSSDTFYSHKLKYLICDVVFEYHSLRSLLNNYY